MIISEKLIFRLCVVCSIIGVALVYLFAPAPLSVNSIDSGMVGKTVSFKARVTSVKQMPLVSFIKTDKAKVVCFNEIPDIRKGDEIHVVGIVKFYKKELEVVASELTLT